MTGKLTKTPASAISNPESLHDFPEFSNLLRKKLAPVFGLPYPVSDLFFRLTVRRFVPEFKKAAISPLRIVNEEVVGGGKAKPAEFAQKLQFQIAGACISKLGLLFHTATGTRFTLERLDFQFLKPVVGGFVVRVSFLPEEARALKQSSGRIFKGIVIVDEQNDLAAKGVAEWTWKSPS